MTHDEKREAVARIIDPEAWDRHDALMSRAQHWSDYGLTGSNVHVAGNRNEAMMLVAPSLAKADPILALTLPPETSEIGADMVLVPRVPTFKMLCAAIDTDSRKLGDISPLGFRCSPQTMFERAWSAMLAAAPTPQAAEPDTCGYMEWADKGDGA